MFSNFFKSNDLSGSVNYQFTCNFFWKAFFGTSIYMDELCQNETNARIFYNAALRVMSRHTNLRASLEYQKLPIYFVRNNQMKGFIIEFPDAKCECECNFIALLESDDGERKYYTSEYYEMDKYFGLCEITFEGQHKSYNKSTNNLEQFLKAIGCEVA